MTSRTAHLVRRFVRAMRARAPSAADEAWADAHLLPGERAHWIEMSDADRDHSLAVARRVVAAMPEAPREVVAAALLHDVGKLESGLGTFERVVATVVGPRGRRYRTYHQHERLGAARLRAAGSDPLTVALVDPDGQAPAALRRLLADADEQ